MKESIASPGFTPIPFGVDGLRWDLPRRPWGGARHVPWLLVAIGIGVVAFAYLWARSAGSSGGLIGFLFAAASVVPALAGAGLVFLGGAMPCGRSRVAFDGHVLTCREYLGPFRWSRSREVAALNRLDVLVGTVSTNGGPKEPTVNVSSLVAHPAESDDLKQAFILTWGYPRAWMHDLADQLAEAIEVEHRGRLVNRSPGVSVTESISSDDDDRAPDLEPARPPDSGVMVSEEVDLVTFEVAPVGIRKGSKGLASFAILWNGFMAIFTGVLMASIMGFGQTTVNGSPWVLAAVLVLFWGVGIGMALVAVHMGRRRTVVDVVGTGAEAVLLVSSHSPIRGIKQHQWTFVDLTAVVVGPSGMEVNKVPILELQIQPHKGRKRGFLSQLRADDLRWLAWHLRQTLDAARSDSDSVTEDRHNGDWGTSEAAA